MDNMLLNAITYKSHAARTLDTRNTRRGNTGASCQHTLLQHVGAIFGLVYIWIRTSRAVLKEYLNYKNKNHQRLDLDLPRFQYKEQAQSERMRKLQRVDKWY